MTAGPLPLSSGADAPPAETYDVALLDLDGVVYVGPDAVPGVPEALARAVAAGMRLGYVTNNAARTPEQVAEHLTELGVPADPTDVITSSQAASSVVAERFGACAMTLEMPYKDNPASPEPEQGWSPERCKMLARDCLASLLEWLETREG